MPKYVCINTDTPQEKNYIDIRKAIGKAIGSNMIKKIDNILSNWINNFKEEENDVSCV